MDNVVEAATAEIRRHWSYVPDVAVVLGTGLGQFARHMAVDVTRPYGETAGFAPTTALSHRGCVVCGRLSGVPLLVFDGRCHFYEGYAFEDVTLPVRVAHACGASAFMATNACGGLRRHFSPGDVMIIEDHINLMGRTGNGPLAGFPLPRRPRRAATPYDPHLIDMALSISRRRQFAAHRGVYAGVTGPNYETRAEYSFLRQIGADAVGMSTVPEVQVAAELDMRILGLSVVTNVAHCEGAGSIDARHVVDAARQAEPRVRQILAGVIQTLRGGQ